MAYVYRIVIFGEVVPQSICVRYGLPIGAWMAPFVLALMYFMSPIAWPIAKLLDRFLGEDHGTIYKKAGLKTLVTLHKTLGEAGEQLNSDEVTIISAVLDLKEKSVGSIMTPMEDVFTMSADTVLDEPTMDLILSQGYSRIPIYSPDKPMNFVGMLLVKMLITYDPEDCKTVRDFALATLPETRPETSCLDIVNFFQEGKSHMVLVSEYPGEDTGALGVVTLEDVMEELIGEYVLYTHNIWRSTKLAREIIDESDVFIDVHKAIRRMTPAPKSRVPKGKIVEDPVKSSSLLDGESLEGEVGPKSPRTAEIDRHRNSVEAPPPRFQLRKQLSDQHTATLSNDGWVTQRGATDEIREHLKHLGPSNLASRPRQTRYQSVKIKRGPSPSRSGQTDVESSKSVPDMPRQTASPSHQGGIGAGLLQSAGHDAKDGVHAVQLGYGTMGPMITSPDQPPTKDFSMISIPEAVAEEHEPRSHHGDKTRQNSQESTTLSMRSSDSPNGDRTKASSPSTYLHHGPARSGSITEQVVDVDGVRKVVLHTTGSPSSSDTEGRPPKDKDFQQDKDIQPDKYLLPPVTSDPETDNQPLKPSPSTNGPRKKRRKRRRGHSSKKPDNRQSDESQPLLSQ